MSDLVSAEIGIGRGTLLRASGRMFQKAYGSDLALAQFKFTEPQLAVPDNVMLLKSLAHHPD